MKHIPQFDNATQAAQWAIQNHWDGQLPVNPVALCKRLGIECKLHDFGDDTVVQAGLKNGQPIILICRKSYEADTPRWRFAMAHALGHVLMHKDQLKEIGIQAPSAPKP